MSQWDKWQGLDYKSQKNVVEDLNSCTVDPDEESKVRSLGQAGHHHKHDIKSNEDRKCLLYTRTSIIQ